MADASSNMKHKISTRWLFILLMVVSSVTRFALCASYLSGDETRILKNAIHFFANHTLVPTHFNYPTLFSYLSAIPIKIGSLLLVKRGLLQSANQLFDLHSDDSILPILPARLTSAIFGVLTVVVLYKIGEKIFNRETGLIAAAIMGFSNMHLFYSGYAYPDATMTFFATCSLLFSLRLLEKQSHGDYFFAGIFAGLSAATKYNGAFIFIALLCVHFVNIRNAKSILSARYHSNLLLAIAAFACSFIIGTPGWIIAPKPFWHALMYERAHMTAGDLYDVGPPYLRQLYSFWRWEKSTALLFALGSIHAVYTRRKKYIVLIMLVAACFAYIGSLGKKDIHHLMFLFPALSLLAAGFLFETAMALKQKVSVTAAVFLMILAFAFPVYHASSQAAEQRLEDNRWTAQKWIKNNIPGGSKIVVDWAYVPKLYRARMETSSGNWELRNRLLEEPSRNEILYKRVPIYYEKEYLIEADAEYLITSSGCFDRYVNTPSPPRDSSTALYHKMRDFYSALLFDAESHGWKLLKRFDRGKGHEIVIYERISETRRPETIPQEHL